MSEPGIIRVLPDTLANKIAAGEVVQRPASVAKELLENAIDAGASNVHLVLKQAGRELVQSVDDGCGMSAEDAVMCFRRHATSKIRHADDLLQLYTLGFRGEAMAAIGSVAQVELKTKRVGDEAGTLIRLNGGEMVSNEPCATPNGTSIAVRNLFYNVPARRNFLKSNATEFKHLVETFQFIALSNPDVGFKLTHDGNVVHDLPALSGASIDEALKARIGGLFGDKAAASLVPVGEETSYLSMNGFVAKPEFSRRTRGEQFLFVNGRYIKSRHLDHAVSNAYGDMLPKGSYPFYALFLRVDPQHVDVNVHPTKAEVKFDDERGVYGFVLAVVRKALGSADITPNFGFDASGRLKERYGTPILGRSTPPAGVSRPPSTSPSSTVGSFDSPANPTREYERADPDQRDIFAIRPDRSEPGRILFGMDAAAEPPGDAGDGARSRVVPAAGEPAPDVPEGADTGDAQFWQLHDKYIFARIRSGTMIVDQHAAHERILYEQALRAMESQFGMTQQLLFPHTLTFEPADYELLGELLPDLRGLGFDVERFGGTSVVIRGVPADLAVGDERGILDEILQQYKTYQDTLQITGRDNLAKSLSCRRAIKAGQALSQKEMRTLIDELFTCELPYACPHGRPTMIKISLDELDRRFGRVGHLER